MVLLITDCAIGSECARLLAAATKVKTDVAPNMRVALTRLREKEYRAVVLDDSMAETTSSQFDVVVKHLGTAVPVFVNFAISAKERVVRDVTTALRRVEAEKQLARRSVEWELRSQLKADLTGILLSAEQAQQKHCPPSGEAHPYLGDASWRRTTRCAFRTLCGATLEVSFSKSGTKLYI